MKHLGFFGRMTALILVGTLAMGCDLLGSSDSSTTEKKGTLKLEDIYAATLALVASSQLSGVFVADPSGDIPTAEEAAQKAHAALQAVPDKCVQSSVSGAVLTVDFKDGCQAPGSPVAIKGVVEGTYTVKDGPPKALQVSLKFTNFGSGDKTATGTGKLVASPTATGYTATVEVKMSTGTAALDGGFTAAISVDKDKKAFEKVVLTTVDPTTVSVDDSKVTVQATDVTFEAGACYPSAGKIFFTSAGVEATLAFDANTKATGIAKFTKPFLKTPKDQELPGIGWKCK